MTALYSAWTTSTAHVAPSPMLLVLNHKARIDALSFGRSDSVSTCFSRICPHPEPHVGNRTGSKPPIYWHLIKDLLTIIYKRKPSHPHNPVKAPPPIEMQIGNLWSRSIRNPPYQQMNPTLDRPDRNRHSKPAYPLELFPCTLVHSANRLVRPP